mgnify:CR=1 FL=1
MESKKKKNQNKKNENKEKQKVKEEEIEEEIEEEEIENNSNDDNDSANIDTDNNWSQFILNNKLSSNLSKIFPEPTNIQKKTLIYTNAKVDLIIQARTGEGKTLCYAIPVLNYILNFYDHAPDMQKKISPVAIILVPTHELGVQVKNHIEKVIQENMDNNKKKESDDKKRLIYNIKIANVLGGFAKAKQLKRLNKFNPEIVVATPGRLWEIIDNDESPILENLKYLKFLIIDEADRMTQTGHFKELKNIIEHIYSRIEIKGKRGVDKNRDLIKEKLKDLGFDDQEINGDEDEEENKKIAKSLNIDYDNIETIDPMALMGDNPDLDTLDFKNAKIIKDEDEEEEESQESNEEEYKEEDEKEDKDEVEEEINEESENEENEEESDEESDDERKKNKNQKIMEKERKEIKKTIMNLKKENIKEGEEVVEYEKSVNLRTILCSATIDSLKKAKSFKKSKKKKKDSAQNTLTDEQKHFQNLIKNLKFYNKLLYIKLKGSENLLGDLEDIDQEKIDSLIDINEPSMLPSKLEIDSYKCESSIKDYYLYYILRKNINSKIIVFTNSISHTKKLHSIFSYFNEFTFCCLHSRMMQNVRMKNLEKFTESKSAILFCTDIGARGLDIPKVDLVIHYHIPTRTDIFVHRSGRTARANQSGKVSSLISGKELGLYRRTMIDLNYKQFSMNTLPLGQLEKIKSLFEYAKELERDNYKYVKENREKMWYKNAAKQCDMIYDDYGEDREDEFDEEERREKEQEKKMLNKKRKIESKIKFQRKKIYTKLNENNIKRTSFLGPDQIEKLNALMKDDNFKNQNITQALFEAKKDLRSLKPKYKPRQRRYMKRRRGH